MINGVDKVSDLEQYGLAHADGSLHRAHEVRVVGGDLLQSAPLHLSDPPSGMTQNR